MGGYAAARSRSSTSSAIWIAFSAAPLRRLSLARKSARPCSTVGSRRMRPTSTSSTPAALPGDGNSSSPHRRRRGEQLARALGSEVVLELDPDRLGVADHHRHAHAGRLDRQLGQLHDLARLVAQLRLLVELLAVEVPVHAQVVLVLRLVAQPFHRLRAGAGDRLVRRDAHAHEPGRLVQRLQDAGERDRAAVRVGDDAVVLERAHRIHLRHDERNAGLEPVGRRLVDRERAAAHGVRHELAGGARADREQEDVDVAARRAPRASPPRRCTARAACRPSAPTRRRARARSRAAAAARSVTRADGACRADDADPGATRGRRHRGARARRRRPGGTRCGRRS